MAQHVITLPQKVSEDLTLALGNMMRKQRLEELPSYAEFVDNLMKALPTEAEELHHAATGIAGEAGEILDQTKKVWIYGKELNVEHLIEELGDLRFYYQALLNMLRITDEEVQAQNIKKLRARYVDGKYSDQHAIERRDKVRRFIGSNTESEHG